MNGDEDAGRPSKRPKLEAGDDQAAVVPSERKKGVAPIKKEYFRFSPNESLISRPDDYG